MNRNIEWKIFIDDVRKELPEQIDFSAQKAVWNVRDKPHTNMFIKVPIASFCMLIVIFITLANASTKFSKAIKSIPFLYKIIKFVTVNPNLREAVFK